jgi:SAM-dependent methyltransferase
MASGSYERLSSSAAGTAFKQFLRRLAPDKTAKAQRAVRAARRAMLEPGTPELSSSQLLWDPPPRRRRVWPVIAGEVTTRLFSRLTDEDLATMQSRMTAKDAALWGRIDDAERPVIALHFCIHYRVPGVLEKTGLTDAEPPAGVAAPSRGSLAAGGSLYYADLIADSLRGIGADLSMKRRALDFGCSSGRMVRILAPTYAGVEWHACDPDETAINWAAKNLPGASFVPSGLEPPLPFPEHCFDLVYAIGIWTHYSEPAALRWLGEVHRVTALGGHVLLTAAGYQSLEMHAGQWGGWSSDLIADTATRLYTDGHKFVGGVGRHLSLEAATPDWGEAFFTPEWLADRACPGFAIVDYKPGCVENNHDLYVLERRA